ncbi:MAG: ABC transporter ATP-binding protein [Prevotella sp.]|nr:ABC transporter ATP-binding protein [Prevotella sp.]
MITISQLRKQFGQTTACDIPQLSIQQGELVGLVGNNGAGKTTLFRLLLDLLKPDGGSVVYQFPSAAPINPQQSEDWKNFTGAYIDESFLIDYLTPEEYFAFLGRICGMSSAAVAERQQELEPLTGGEVFGQKKLIRNLSAGNRQKVGIIAALFNRPQLLILDEPFNFLDPTSQSQLKHTLADYCRETGATVLISSHNLQHTVDIATRILLLERGVIVRDLPNAGGSAAAELEAYFEV